MDETTKLCPIVSSENMTLEEYLESLGLSRSWISKISIKQSSKKKLKQNLNRLLSDNVLELNKDFLNRAMANPIYTGNKIEVLFENDDFIAIDKPSKVHCYPQEYLDSKNCVSFLRHNSLSQFIGQFPESFDKGLLYRLDFDTSGVVVFVKKRDIYEKITSNRESYIRDKIYQCRVYGKFDRVGILEHYLSPYGPKGAKMIESDSFKGTKATLEILECHYNQSENTTDLKIKLFTGLRHQIRCQLSSSQHPIVGDPLYSDIEVEGSLMLHAYQYTIELDGREYTFSSEPYWSKGTS